MMKKSEGNEAKMSLNWRERKLSSDQIEGKGSQVLIKLKNKEANLWPDWRTRKLSYAQIEGQGG